MKHLARFFLPLALAMTPLASAAPSISSFEITVTGKGRPMILIPGLACPGEVWDSTVAHFRERFECHVVSLAGFGGSPPHGGEELLLDRVRDDLATYIREHRLERPVVVGHSLGGFLTLALAARHPDLVGELVVVDGAPFLIGLIRPGASPADGKAAAASMRSHFDSMDDAANQQMIRSGAVTRAMVTSDSDHARIVAWCLASDRATVAQAMAPKCTGPICVENSLVSKLPLSFWPAGLPTRRLSIASASLRLIGISSPACRK